MIHQYSELLSPSQIQEVHEASLEILEQVGLRVQNEEARQVFVKQGCKLEHEKNIIKIPGAVVEQFLKSIPPTFHFNGRDPQNDRTIPNDRPVLSTASAAPNIHDPQTGKVRRARSDDIARIAHLVNQLPGYDTFSISVTADDAPPGQFSLARLYPALKHCSKPVLCSPPALDELANIFRLGAMIAGSETAFWAHPFITFVYTSVISPLTMDSLATEKLMRYTEYGIPCFGAVVPTAGVSAPFTLLGALALTNAEVLAALVLEQMVKPGKETIYSVLPSVTDIRTAGYAPGGIETGILTMACAQMARHYKIPSGGFAGQTNAKCIDAQSGFETGMSPLAVVMAGLDFNFLGGLLDAMMVFDYAKLVVDNEVALMLKKAANGIPFTSEDLALDVITAVGPGGMFTDKAHTVKHMRTTPFLPVLADRSAWKQWEETGRSDVQLKAMQQVHQILAHANPAVFSPDLEARIRAAFVDLVAGDLAPMQAETE